jgi:choline dehydrogenase-like flavoprotein
MAFDFDVIIIGSGFGATVLALDQNAKNKRILILERGVWWLTPELSAENPMNPFLKTRSNATCPILAAPRSPRRRHRSAVSCEGYWRSGGTTGLCKRHR